MFLLNRSHGGWPLAASRPVLLLAVLALGHGAALAQGVTPDAGSLRQQIEQPRELTVPALPPKRVAPPPPIQPRDGLSVTVKSFRFAGNRLVDSDRLAESVADFLNRPLGFDGLQKAADAVAAAYREAGWIARVYLPEQDISEGVVTLQIVEGRLSGLRFEGEPPRRVHPELLRALVHNQQALGEPLAADALDRALLLADDLPGVSVAGTLEPGQADGDTALVLQTTDEPLVYGDLSLDNTGSRSTGKERLAASLNINSPSQQGELLSFNLMQTQGSQYARVAMSAPVEMDGLRATLSVSELTYKTLSGLAVGRSDSLGLDLNYPLVRSRLHNLYLLGGIETKGFRNWAGSTVKDLQSDYQTNALRLGVSGNWFDALGGGGANAASLQVLWGRLTDVIKHPAGDAIEHQYRKLSYTLSRQQAINVQHSLFVSFSGQHARQLLDSSERYYIGGASSVRAYPASEHGGDRGHTFTGEWRWRLDGNWVATAFADLGRVQTSKAPTDGSPNPIDLRGRGLSLSWRGPAGLNARLTWAHRNGGNPKPYNGKDSDGTLLKDRYWLTLSLPF